MNIVNTAVPIAIEDLKKFFTDKSTFYIINYKDSKLKGAKLLTYLSNLEIPCDIDLSNLEDSEKYELLKDYMLSPMIVNIKSLELLTIDVLNYAKNLNITSIHSSFVENNVELIDDWISKLDSLTIYNMYSIDNPEFKEFAKQFPVSDRDDLTGVNFVSLLKHESFYSFYSKIEKEKLKFYNHYFNDYMFKGKSLFSYWANENNPLFLLTYGIAEGLVDSKQYNEAKRQTVEESHVTPV